MKKIIKTILKVSSLLIFAILFWQIQICVAVEPLSGKAYQLADQAYKALNIGDLDLADKATNDALSLSPDHPQLLGIKKQILSLRQNLAFKLADEGYKAVEVGDLEKADIAARKALAIKPDHPEIKKLYAYVQKLYEQRALRIADKAYKEVANGNLDKANELTQEALKLQPENPQILALLAQIQIMRNEDEAAAKTLDKALAVRPGYARVLGMRGFLLISQGNDAGAKADFKEALNSGELTQEEGGNVAMGLADLYGKEKKYQEAINVLHPYVEGGSDRIISKWQANQIHTGTLPETKTLIHSPEVKYALTTRAYKELGGENFKNSLELFLAAEKMGGLTAVQYGDAGYAARRSIENEHAVRLFMKAIDAALSDPAEINSLSPREIFGLRRAIDDLKRDWGFIGSTILAHGGGTTTSGSGSTGTIAGNANPIVSGPDAFVQMSGQVYYQPPVIGYRDGRQFQVFMGSFMNLNDGNGGPIGGQTGQGSVGVRWKPIRDKNLIFTAERLFAMGHLALNDWLLRIGYSYDHGVDIKPYLKNWSYRRLFVETAYLTDSERSINNLEARWGHVFRFSNPRYLTFIPHILFSADFDSASLQRFNAGLGIGTSFRLWFRETTYRAPASFLDLTMQYKFGLVEDATRQDGVFARLTLWY
ncbi:MAG: NfrA family protein [Nitrospinales bacterium]